MPSEPQSSRGQSGSGPARASRLYPETRRSRAGGRASAASGRAASSAGGAGPPRRSVARVPSARTTSRLRTWSAVSPYATERAPAELLAIMPPRVARLAVATSGPKARPCGRGRPVERVEHHAGAHARLARGRLDGHVGQRRAVDDQAGADGLAGQAGARAAHGERHAVGPAGGDRGLQVGRLPGAQDGPGKAPVEARVARVQLAGRRVGADLPGDLAAQALDQARDVHRRDPRGPATAVAGTPASATLPQLSGAPGTLRAAQGPRVLRRGRVRAQ